MTIIPVEITAEISIEHTYGELMPDVAKDVTSRMSNLQTSSPSRLSLLAVVANAGVSLERSLHRKFANHRVCREWFAPCNELLEAIDAVRD